MNFYKCISGAMDKGCSNLCVPLYIADEDPETPAFVTQEQTFPPGTSQMSDLPRDHRSGPTGPSGDHPHNPMSYPPMGPFGGHPSFPGGPYPGYPGPPPPGAYPGSFPGPAPYPGANPGYFTRPWNPWQQLPSRPQCTDSFGFYGPPHAMSPPPNPVPMAAPSASAGSAEQVDQIVDLVTQKLSDKPSVSAVQNKRKLVVTSKSAKKAKVDKVTDWSVDSNTGTLDLDDDVNSDLDDEQDGAANPEELLDSDGDSEIQESVVEEVPLDFKKKLQFVENVLMDENGFPKVKVNKFLPHSKVSSTMSISDDKDKSGKEKWQFTCPSRYNGVFDSFHSKRRGDPDPSNNRGPRRSMKEGEFPKWPSMSTTAYAMSEAKLSVEAPQLNEALLGQKTSRDKTVTGSGSNLLASESRYIDIRSKDFLQWESTSRKLVHALGFVDMMNNGIQKVLIDAPEDKEGNFSLSKANHEMMLGLLKSTMRAGNQSLSNLNQLALTMTTVRREHVVARLNPNLQDSRVEQLRLSSEERGYLFPKDAVYEAISDLKDTDRLSANSGGSGRYNNKKRSTSAPAKKGSSGNQHSFRDQSYDRNTPRKENNSGSTQRSQSSNDRGRGRGKGGSRGKNKSSKNTPKA